MASFLASVWERGEETDVVRVRTCSQINVQNDERHLPHLLNCAHPALGHCNSLFSWSDMKSRSCGGKQKLHTLVVDLDVKEDDVLINTWGYNLGGEGTR